MKLKERKLIQSYRGRSFSDIVKKIMAKYDEEHHIKNEGTKEKIKKEVAVVLKVYLTEYYHMPPKVKRVTSCLGDEDYINAISVNWGANVDYINATSANWGINVDYGTNDRCPTIRIDLDKLIKDSATRDMAAHMLDIA